MRVLLTGATGFLGRHALAQLMQTGAEIVVLGRSRPSFGEAAFIQADLLDKPDFDALISTAKASHLLHLAWYAEHGQYWESPLNLRWLEATVQLTEAFCQAGGRKAVFAGTCAEYSWGQGTCIEDATLLEPTTLYGISKDATRRLVAAICARHNVASHWARIFFPFGPGEDERRLVPSLIQALSGRRAAFGVNATARRDFLHVADMTAGLTAMLTSPLSGTVNLCSGDPVSIDAVVREIAQQIGADPQKILSLAPAQAGGPTLLAGENHRLTELGWKRSLSLADGLAETIRVLCR